ncbi:MAG: glycosyltransferase family 9 protein, partial [Candidatus Omnitrophica bacterium]|nr:glycosyltransferase family 9 protein [Candidatus Omnitrophota bacterium]
KKRIGFNYRSRGRFLTSSVYLENFDDKHVVEYYLDMLGPLRIEVDRTIAPRVYVSSRDSEWADKELGAHGITGKDAVVGMICGGGASWGVDARYKRWDRNKFAALADKLIEAHGVKIVLLGDEKESELVGDARRMMKSPSLDLSGKTTVGQMAAVISKCKMVITNDGGPLHMASGLGVGTVSIFGPVDEKTYGPYPESDKHIVISRSDVACRPCYKSFRYNKCEDRACLDSITVAEVCAAAQKVLKKSITDN